MHYVFIRRIARHSMLLHEISLRNIRSYEEGSLSFEEGITLLAGDIGAGKSTILQALEFVFFGIQRGGLEGEGLLRHGALEGKVSILFSIGDEDYRVTRSLKRTSQGVRQTDGTLESAGRIEELTPSELKARVLALFGYPEQLLTRSKGLIFRHTVYTAQEEMKHIIFMPEDERLNTLRALFGIEKYKTIQENALAVLKELRADERRVAPRASMVETLLREVEAARTLELEMKERVAHAHGEAKAAGSEVHRCRVEAQGKRAAYEAELESEKRREILIQRSREHMRSIKNLQEDIERVEQYLQMPLEPVEDASMAIEAARAQLERIDKELHTVSGELAELRGTRKVLGEQAQRISALDTCPVCQQPVSDHHKHDVAKRTQEQNANIEQRSSSLQLAERSLQQQKQKFQSDMQRLQDQQRRFAAYQKDVLTRRNQQEEHARYNSRLKILKEELAASEKELLEIPAAQTNVKEAARIAQESLAKAEALLQERMEYLGAAREALGRAEANNAAVEARLTEAKAAHNDLLRLQRQRTWLEDEFLTIVQLVEQHVLASLHAEFRSLFEQWFTRLVGDESLSVSLGDRFQPLARQNGYDAPLEGLSGGEKTAVALSYRLSLYKVVSDFISTIRTKDLLILDEPTDGFSTEQLDRVRDVLRELGCKQVILVSHEPQMETCADNVVRIEKHLHRSEVA